MTVAVQKQNVRGPTGVTIRSVRSRAQRMLDYLERPTEELSVLLTNDDGIHELNRVYRHQDRPTDVLAFVMAEGQAMPSAEDAVLLGDVVISLDTAARQARLQAHTCLEEVTHLLAHGLLHLLGYDHETDEEEREMTLLTRHLVLAAQTSAA